ncbi:MAG: FGGY-family carbohydrate kinase [Deltaproteobacteria bacterium]|nr:FGGY-family carbohydrate kinase [Deltaproteobacteria bacterium]
MNKIFLGIDVGTHSVRVGAFDTEGRMRAKGEHPIRIWRPRKDFAEQSSEDVWRATGRATRKCMEGGRIAPHSVKGLSFDATCSLVALAEGLEPVSVSPTGRPSQNIILWMDHRATEQAERINGTGHEVLEYVGGRMSPEMEPPKLLWLKENLPQTWEGAKRFMDLADYMVYRAAGNDLRSLCTTVCKWTYMGHEGSSGKYRMEFFREIGIPDLFVGDRVPLTSYPMGKYAGGLTVGAAKELGLRSGIPVGVGIIDAHAGGIGSLGPVFKDFHKEEAAFDRAMALIGGTSSCHMAVSSSPRFIRGVWGPYYGAMLPGMWLNEGGQSATGSLIDLMIRDNSSFPKISRDAKARGADVYTYLNSMIGELKRQRGAWLTWKVHMLPYHHGNRSPRADPLARGMVSGLSLSSSPEEVALWYYATLQAIAYGTRHIIEAMNEKGYDIRQIYLCGGHLKNELFVQEHADITGCEVILPEEPEAVLLGSAILGAVAAGEYEDVPQAMAAMCRVGRIIRPEPSTSSFHGAKYEIFKEMYGFQRRIHERMEKTGVPLPGD